MPHLTADATALDITKALQDLIPPTIDKATVNAGVLRYVAGLRRNPETTNSAHLTKVVAWVIAGEPLVDGMNALSIVLETIIDKHWTDPQANSAIRTTVALALAKGSAALLAEFLASDPPRD